MFSINCTLFIHQPLQRKKRPTNLGIMDKNEKEKSDTNCSYSFASIPGPGKVFLTIWASSLERC